MGIAEKVVEWQPLALTIPLLEDDGVVLREKDALALLLEDSEDDTDTELL